MRPASNDTPGRSRASRRPLNHWCNGHNEAVTVADLIQRLSTHDPILPVRVVRADHSGPISDTGRRCPHRGSPREPRDVVGDPRRGRRGRRAPDLHRRVLVTQSPDTAVRLLHPGRFRCPPLTVGGVEVLLSLLAPLRLVASAGPPEAHVAEHASAERPGRQAVADTSRGAQAVDGLAEPLVEFERPVPLRPRRSHPAAASTSGALR